MATVEPKDPLAGMSPNEAANLASFLEDEYLKKEGGRVRERYDRDLSSRSGRMQQWSRLQKMYALIAEKKTIPWAGCANVKTPSLTGPVLQIQARLYDMLWPPTGKVFTVIPGAVADQPFANMAEQFANSYVRYKMNDMSQGISSVLHGKCLYGSAFRKTYWDAYWGKVVSETVPMDDFVVAYSKPSRDPSMSDIPRYTMVHHMTGYEIRQRTAKGLYREVELKRATEDEKTPFREQAERIDGHQPEDDTDDDYTTRQVLEQHYTLRLPNKPKKHPAFDGKEHYVYALVDATSRQILRLSLREEADPDDQRRYDRQAQARQKYEAELAAWQAAQAEVVPPTMSALPEMGGMDSTMPPGMAPQMPMAPPMPAEPPMEVPVPGPVRQRQITFFTHYKCFESDGFYGLGYGDLLFGLVTATNTVINQWVDGMALKNAKPAFMSRQSRMARGTLNIGPGQVTEVDVPAGTIKDAIMFLDPPQADPGTVPLIRMLDAMRDVIAGNADLMSGQAPGSNQTKAGMEILNEQMMAPITVLARQTKEEFRHELDKIWRCWGVFLEDDDVTDIVSSDGQPMQIRVGKWMFTPSVHLVPASDPRMKSQRLEDLKGLTGFVMSLPMMQDPAIGMPIQQKLAEMVLGVYPDGPQLIPLLHPPPPPPPQPMSQLEENVGFLKDSDHPVHPADDDDAHLQDMGAFMMSPDAQALSEKGRMMIANHHRAHIAQRLQKRGAAFGQASFPGGPPPGGPPGMAPGANSGPPPGPPPQ